MNINLDVKTLTKYFLEPINKVTNTCKIKVTPNYLETINSTEDMGIILYGNLKTTNIIEENIFLNILHVERLIRALNCIDEQRADINIDSNSLNYKSPDVKFKFHLAEQDTIPDTPISIDKINSMRFDTKFILSSKKNNEILKGSAFAECEKVYFFTKDGRVYSELTDKNMEMVDSLTVSITETYKGESIQDVLPLDIEVFQLLTSYKQDISVKINAEHSVVLFQIVDKELNYEMKYIVSALVN